MTRRFIAVGALLSVICHAATVDSAFVGTYELAARNGLALPATITADFGTEKCLGDLHSGTLEIRTNGTWTEVLVAQHRCGPDHSDVRPPFRTIQHGTASPDPRDVNRILLTSPETDALGHEQIAALLDDGLLVSYSAPTEGLEMTFLYKRMK